MKVVCIDIAEESEGKKHQFITKGLVYETLEFTPSGVLTKDVFYDAWYIMADNGFEGWYNKKYFKLLDTVRNEKLEKLGI